MNLQLGLDASSKWYTILRVMQDSYKARLRLGGKGHP
mgnify:CR=1 FL=1